MKQFILILSCLALTANALSYVPFPTRPKRDVSELVGEPEKSYLPPQNSEIQTDTVAEEPQQKLLINEAQVEITETTPEADSAVLGANGYEYKTVRKLVVRHRRDVSHLKLNYLPPFKSHQPSNEYLPPVSNELTEENKPSQEYLPPVTEKQVEEIVESRTEIPQPSNEYLPPQKIKEAPPTQAPEPIKEYLPPVQAKEVEETTEVPVTTLAPEEETSAELVEAAQPQEDTAIFAADGYHYKKPSQVPAELFAFQPEPIPEVIPPSPEYLAPASEGSFEVEGPSNGDSAVLAEDGYHYRVVRRRF
ncbi:fibrous sheath CABYR-binding protein-like [Stomoxys calcitrans]|uniref:fibrous sheath CABYR-binding protein-like n=1 Tax=Stomoxys calcitrans TaxID=35570 RepID=UPI0027E29266|nr:fibrous sheath CABYR-binding protein-like [Stomoxys calcitrans]